MITDLTEGRPSAVLLKFSLPMLLSVIFQQMYNIADSLIAGRYAGEDALAAVGASYPVTMIFMAFAFGINIGCSVVISQLFGAKETRDMKTAVSTSLLSTLTVSAILTLIGFVICGPMLRLLQTPDNIFANSALYLQIYIGGILFLFLYNTCNGIFTALGDSRTPLFFLILSSLSNIVLDYVFVRYFHWGVAGVAWATFIAQGISAVLALATLVVKLKKVVHEGAAPKFSWEMLKRISTIAVPSILQQSFVSVGNLFIQGLINSFGSSAIAGFSAAFKLNTLALSTFSTMGNAYSSYTAQNIGAEKIKRIQHGFKSGLLLTLSIAIPFAAVYFVFAPHLILLFLPSTSAGTDAVDAGAAFLKIASPFYFAVAIKLLADGVLRGSGSMKAFMAATFLDLILRVILAYIFAPVWGIVGIWASWPVGWFLAALLSVFFYISGIWKPKNIPNNT